VVFDVLPEVVKTEARVLEMDQLGNGIGVHGFTCYKGQRLDLVWVE
jgi:hypothetical protein